MFLGFADYMSHERERLIAFAWWLRRAMPADPFREAKRINGAQAHAVAPGGQAMSSRDRWRL